MQKQVQLVIISIFMICTAYGQSPVADSLVDEGIKLHDKADYEGAVELYTKALAIDKSSLRANYEIGSTYIVLKKYDKAIEHSDIILDLKPDYGPGVYIIKGNAQDLTGDPKGAIKTYKKGLKKFQDHHMLCYNLAYTLFTQKEFKEAEEALQNGLISKPAYPSNHLLLAYLMDEQGNRMQSILALYNFLLLEPGSDRALKAFALLDKLLAKGTKKTGEKETTIFVDMSKKSSEFSAAELTLGLLNVSSTLEKNKDKTEEQLFAENTALLFNILGETKKNKGFWANYYVDFFYELTKAKHSEALSYYISQSDTSEAIKNWINNNKEKVNALLKWVDAYERKS